MILVRDSFKSFTTKELDLKAFLVNSQYDPNKDSYSRKITDRISFRECNLDDLSLFGQSINQIVHSSKLQYFSCLSDSSIELWNNITNQRSLSITFNTSEPIKNDIVLECFWSYDVFSPNTYGTDVIRNTFKSKQVDIGASNREYFVTLQQDQVILHDN